MMGIKRGLAFMIYKYFDKKSEGSDVVNTKLTPRN